MILVLGSPEDELVRDIAAVADERGREVLHVSDPAALHLCWELPSPARQAYIGIGDRRIPSTDLSGVLVRTLPAAALGYGTETDDEYLSKEWLAALLGFLAALPCPVINRPHPLRSFRQPLLPRWAAEISAAGLRLPDMLVTRSPAEAADFHARYAGAVREVSPHCLIATPSGIARRVVVAGSEACAVPAGMPGLLAARCLTMARLLGLGFAEFQVVSGAAGDTVMAIDDFPGASAWPPEVRGCIARALVTALAGAREEVPA
jgi:hypothetical protein